MVAPKRVRAWEITRTGSSVKALLMATAAAAAGVAVLSTSGVVGCTTAASVLWQHGVGRPAGRIVSGIRTAPKAVAEAATATATAAAAAVSSRHEITAARRLVGRRRATTDSAQVPQDSHGRRQTPPPSAPSSSSPASVTTTSATATTAKCNTRSLSLSGSRRRRGPTSLFFPGYAARSEVVGENRSNNGSIIARTLQRQWLRRGGGKGGLSQSVVAQEVEETRSAGETQRLGYSRSSKVAAAAAAAAAAGARVVPAAGAATAAAAGYSEVAPNRRTKKDRTKGEPHLSFREALFAGALSRSIAHTCVHPAIVVKTIMQGRGTSWQLSNLSFQLLTRGSGAQFVMSLPHGAFNYATLEVIMGFSSKIFPAHWRERAGPALDFISSGVATLLCSVISTPQIVMEDRIITGMYPNLMSGVREMRQTEGLRGFYTGWSANVSQKIPSYGLTWVFYQASKRLYKRITDRAPTATESFMLGAASAGGAVCVMIPLDMVLTRVVTQRAQAGVVPYKGVVRTLSRIIKEEGLRSMYSSLPAKLVSVVPAIGIQFGIYDYFRKQLISRKGDNEKRAGGGGGGGGEEDEEAGLLLRDGVLPSSVRRRLGIDGRDGRGGDDNDDDFARKLYLLEEELV